MTLPTNITVGDPDHAGLHNAERAAINAKPDDFVDLGDTPADLSGEAGKLLVVNTAGNALELALALPRVPNVQADDYTLVLADAARAVEMDKATGNSLTVPPNSSVAFPVGTMIPVTQVGEGQTSIVEGSGVTVETPETLGVAGRWGTVWLRKRSTNGWVLSGDVEVGS